MFAKFPRLFVVCSAFLVLSLVGCERADPEVLIARAEQAYVNKDYRAAILDLKSVLQTDSGNTKARWMLAEVYLAIENGASAQKELEWVRARGVDEDAVIPALAHSLWLQGKYDDVLDLPIESVRSQFSSGELRGFRSLAWLGMNQIEKAQNELVLARAANASSRYVRFAEAGVLVIGRRWEDALTSLNDLNADHPEFAAAWGLLGKVMDAKGNPVGAEEAYDRALSLRPWSLQDRLRRGFARVALRKWDEARADADILQVNAPRFALGHYLAGVIAAFQGQFELSQEALERAYELAPRHMQTVTLLAAIDGRVGNNNRSRQLAEQAVAIESNFIPARKLLATWHLRDGMATEAERLIRPVVLAKPDDLDAKNLLAASLIAQGKSQEGSALLQSIAVKQPDSPVAQLRAGLGLIEIGDAEAGMVALNRAVAIAPDDPSVHVSAVTALLRHSEIDNALQQARSFLQKNPDSVDAINLMAAAQLASGQRQDAVDSYDRALQLAPENLKALQMRGMLALAAGESETGLAIVRKGLTAYPDDLQLLLMQARAARKLGNSELVHSSLQRAIDSHPDDLDAKALLAREYLDQDQTEKALLTVSGLVADDHVGVLAVRAEAYRRLNRHDDARRDLEVLAALLPESFELHVQLLRSYEVVNDVAGLERTIKRIFELKPNDPMALLAKARFAVMTGRFAEARRLLESDVFKENESSVVLSTWLRLARGENNVLAEVQYAQRLFDERPNSANAVSLSRARDRSGDPARAEKILVQWLNEHPDDLAVLSELANIQVRRGDTESAIVSLRHMASVDSKNVGVLNSLASYLLEEDPREAKKYAKLAFDVSPGDPLVVANYASVLAEGGEYAKALRLLTKAIDRGRQIEELRLRLAEVLIKSGDRKSAMNELEVLLRDASDSAFRQRVEQLHAEIADNEG